MMVPHWIEINLREYQMHSGHIKYIFTFYFYIYISPIAFEL